MRACAKQEVKSRGWQAKGFDVLFAQACVHCANKPDRSVLITIIKWHFQFHLVNVSILHLKYQYGAPSESCFACYVTWCPLTTGIVAPQCPSAYGSINVGIASSSNGLSPMGCQAIIWTNADLLSIVLLPKSHNAPVPYPTMHHLVTEMCTRARFCYKMVHCGIFVWCIVGFVRWVY